MSNNNGKDIKSAKLSNNNLNLTKESQFNTIVEKIGLINLPNQPSSKPKIISETLKVIGNISKGVFLRSYHV